MMRIGSKYNTRAPWLQNVAALFKYEWNRSLSAYLSAIKAQHAIFMSAGDDAPTIVVVV